MTTGTKVGGFACDGDAKTVVHNNSYFTKGKGHGFIGGAKLLKRAAPRGAEQNC